MFTLEGPTMVLNAADAPVQYKMMNTMPVPASDTPDHFLGWAGIVADGFPGKRIRSLVLNCHGYYNGSTRDSTGGYGLKLGVGVFRRDSSKFSVLKGKVDMIYITACGAARISKPDAAGDGDGNLFCCEIAKAAGAYVYAGTTQQISYDLPIYGTNQIADYDGLVLRYTPEGKVDWSKDYGRGIIAGLKYGWN